MDSSCCCLNYIKKIKTTHLGRCFWKIIGFLYVVIPFEYFLGHKRL